MVFAFSINSRLVLVFENRSRIRSTDSSGFKLLVAFRIISTASFSSAFRSRWSFLVLDFMLSWAGKIRFSESFRSRTSYILPGPLNSS